MTPFDSAFAQLNSQQQQAVCAAQNTVVTAGAGSGKTRVLACRYAYLIMKRHFQAGDILTLTFTNKATNEMYERIYTTLSENGADNYARQALNEFYKANIQTLDSFCAKIARSGAPFFGIAPDFSSGEAALDERAVHAALSFVLDNRENKALQTIVADKKIKSLAVSLFAQVLLNESAISRPLDFNAQLEEQKKIILADYPILIEKIEAQAAEKKNPARLPPPAALEPILNKTGDAETESERRALIVYYHAVLSSLPKKIAKEFAPLVNWVLQFDVLRDVYTLLAKFQTLFAAQKRRVGLLSFNDIACLAVDTLKRYSEIRQVYQNEIKAIMVDEFQDNNTLQKDLLFLLAGSEEKLFFVGDEKQSIYRFRGADVSVFRELSQQLPSMRLEINYRSRLALISAFNVLFKDVFLVPDGIQPYDAEFMPLGAAPSSEAVKEPCMHIALFNEDSLPDDKNGALNKYEIEAAYCAQKIDEIVRVRRSCAYDDIAVLLRKKTHQNELERALKLFGIPYNAEEPVSLFNEAFINDALAYLRLLVYPRDKLSYAALLRSPFVRVGDAALTILILRFNKKPFDAALAAELDADDAPRYLRACEEYAALKAALENGGLSLPALINKLWYEAGYRYEALSFGAAQTDAYDYFFELACRAQSQGKTPALFLQYLDDIQKSGFDSERKKIEGLDIPVERGAGIHILTVHKSKGLEFPVVFIYGCGNIERAMRNNGVYYAVQYKKEFSLITLNLPHAAELKGTKPANYFYEKFKDDEQRKAAAELRRLVYVAATRAQNELYWTGTIPPATQQERRLQDANGETESLLQRIQLYCKKREWKKYPSSILDLIAPSLAEDHADLWTINEIPYCSRIRLKEYAAKIRDASSVAKAKKNDERCRAALPYYKSCIREAPPLSAVQYTAASALRCEDADAGTARHTPQSFILRDDTVSAADFGTIVHSIIEERFRAGAPQESAVQTSILRSAQKLAQHFFDSELGKRALAAPFCKIEYPFISHNEEGSIHHYINGKIDLLFCDDGGYCIVDYKTDRIVEPERHIEQLRVYRDAVLNLYGTAQPVKAYLFYLRSGKVVEAA